MIVFAETNFVLELVFRRDKSPCCRALIDLAANQQISLKLPAYSIVEPHEAIIRRRKSRAQVHDSITRELKEITRSLQFEEEAHELAQLTSLLIQVGETEQNEMRQVVSQLLQVAEIVDLNAAILQQAVGFQDQLALSPQDSVVFATVSSALGQCGGPACFVTTNTNSKDFASPGIAEALDPFDCKVLFDFENGLNYVRSKLAGTA